MKEEMRNERDKIHTYELRNGEFIMFKSDIPDVEIKNLPIFQNQHAFNKYFIEKGYQLVVDLIIKK